MEKAELDIQKRFVTTFQELKQELELNSSKVMATGWQQRNELISHVYSNYNNHEKLNSKREEHQKLIQRGNIIKYIYETMQEKRDLYGYFDSPETIIQLLENLIKESIEKELYEVAHELNVWLQQLKA